MFYEKIKSNWIEILIYLGGYKEKSPCMQGEILVYDKKSCVITARSCCRYSQFKGILFHEKGNPSTHGEEISLDREEFFNIKREIILYLKRNSFFKEKRNSFFYMDEKSKAKEKEKSSL